MTNLRQAAQQAQYWQGEAERYASNTEYWRKRCKAAEKQAEPEQEPVKLVSYNCKCGRTMNFESVHGVVAPQRPWQGLTPDEVKHLYPYGRSIWGKETFEAIEKALKEKNSAN